MPHEMSVDVDKRIVTIRMWGEIAGEELRVAAGQIRGDARVQAGFVELIDARDVTSVTAIQAKDIRELAASVLDPSSRRAFVAPDSAAFGLARMFAALRKIKDAQEDIGVFRTMPEAEAWLGLAAV